MDLTQEILTDRTKYPDDRKIVIADGVEITVGEFRNQLMPKADFTRYTESARKKERELQETLDGTTRALTQALEERKRLEEEGRAKPLVTSGELTEADLSADPVLGPMYRQTKELADLVKQQQAIIKQQGDRIDGHERTWTRQNFLTTIGELKKRDTNLDVEAFLAYSQRKPVIDTETQVVDLESTYRNFAHDRLTEEAVKAAEERGIEKGKQLAKVPAIPYGRHLAPTRPEGLPESLDKLTDEQVLNDPEMQAAMRGEPVV